MDKERVLHDQTVLVEGGWITRIGPARQVSIPVGAVRIDGKGKYLLPGLADMHAHIFGGTHINNAFFYGGTEEDTAGGGTKLLFLWLANGVTTVRNMNYSNEEQGKEALRLRSLSAAGETWIPRIYTAGQWGPNNYISDNPGTSNNIVLDSVAKYVAAYKARGYDFIKVHNESPVVLDSVLAVAKRIGIPVVGHVPPPTHVEHIIPLGYKSIEHPFTDYIWGDHADRFSSDTVGFRALAGALGRAGIWHCPTQQHYDMLHYDFEFDGYSPKMLKVEQDSGVKLLLGNDEVPWQGVITAELEAMVFQGLTPYQALLTGTRNVAEYFGTLEESGTITAGKRADMVLLTGNPLKDVRYTAQPLGVMLGGRWLPREEIERRLDTLTLVTYAPGYSDVKLLSVKSYWRNAADRAMYTASLVLDSTRIENDESPEVMTKTQQAKYKVLLTTHREQMESLGDSLGTSDRYVAGTERILRLAARQIGEDRENLSLTPQQLVKYDRRAKAWLQRRKQEGYSLTIPGVR